MPDRNADRDGFVAKIARRRTRARMVARLRAWSRQPSQAEVYDTTFRSDAEAVSYAYALRNDHLPDLENPKWFIEKVRWQFLNHPNPLMTFVADKLNVREYLRFRGARIQPARLLACGKDPQTLAEMTLPERFMLKSNHGSGQNFKMDGDEPVSGARLAKLAAEWNELDQWRRTGELHYRGIDKHWLMEELLPAGAENREYQITCIHGEPHHIHVILERRGKGVGALSQMVMDPKWRPLDFHSRGSPSEVRDEPRPADLALMLDEARRLSADFMNVRVDFLRFGDRLTFSELTFANAAARVPLEPEARNAEIGALLDLTQAPGYLAHGERVLAEMGCRAAA